MDVDSEQRNKGRRKAAQWGSTQLVVSTCEMGVRVLRARAQKGCRVKEHPLGSWVMGARGL